MNTNYVIYSPGRTGSHIILEILTGGQQDIRGGLCHSEPYWHPYSTGTYDAARHLVIHTHDIKVVDQLGLPRASTVLILSGRRDTFAQVMSSFVAQMSNEWNGKDYTNKPVIPKAVDRAEFITMCDRYQQWPKKIVLQDEYKKIVSIDYEDITNSNSAQYIAAKIDVEYCADAVGTVHKKSSRRYQDYITNWAELKKLHDTRQYQ